MKTLSPPGCRNRDIYAQSRDAAVWSGFPISPRRVAGANLSTRSNQLTVFKPPCNALIPATVHAAPVAGSIAHRVRTAQTTVEAAQKRASHAKKVLEKDSLSPEKRGALAEAIALADKLSATPPIPHAGPIFASEAGTARNMNNLLNRQILPSLNQCQRCNKPEDGHAGADHKYKRDESLPSWHGWHGFRRGLGTNLKRLGVDLKTIQEILSHAHIATTADIYVKEISEQAVEAMERLEKHVDAELKKSPELDPAIPYSAPNLHQGGWIAKLYVE